MLTVFAGSGASHAVSADAYPTTKGFFERLPEEIKSDRLFRLVLEFAASDSPSSTLDIEQILWHVDELRNALVPFRADRHIAAWFTAGSRLQQVLGRNVDSNATFQLLADVAQEADRLRAAINRRVYELYGSPPSGDDLARTWRPLFDHLKANSTRAEFFTTNYDVVIEEAARTAGYPLITGRSAETMPRLDESRWQADLQSRTGHTGLLTKLHGSVDWVRGANGTIFTGSPNFVGDHDKHVILYPGFKGRPDRAPFDAFHTWFAKALRVTDYALFIGFAFRDSYINDLLRNNLPDNARVAVIDPATEVERVGLGSRDVAHVSKGLSAEAVSDAITGLGLRQSN